MNTDAKNKELLALCGTFTDRQRIVFSDEGNLTSPSRINREYQRNKATRKPDGLWYSFGSAWVDYLANEKDFHRRCDLVDNSWATKRLAILTHVYKLSLNRRWIWSIRTMEELNDLTRRYGIKSGNGIRWDQLEDDGWGGIEIKFIPQCHNTYWYVGWDISSGCIWDKKAVRNIELVKAWKPEWKTTRSQVRRFRRSNVES